MRILSFSSCLFLLAANALAQAPPIQWKTCLGGSDADGQAPVVRETADGGAIVAGWALSNDGDVTGHHGAEDAWVVKLSATGALEWQKALGGSNTDRLVAVELSSDGGYLVAGWTLSDDGDVLGFHGGSDLWVVKLSGAGDVLWQRPLGGTGGESHNWAMEFFQWRDPLEATSDGGCVALVTTGSSDGDVTGHHGMNDFWVVRLDGNGALLWQKALGGSNQEAAMAIALCPDGGVVVAGSASSTDGDVVGQHGNSDYWVVKLDAAGGIDWTRALGGTLTDAAYDVQPTSDGGYIVVGWTQSSDGDVAGMMGPADIWAVKLDAGGALQWQQPLGGPDGEIPTTVRESTTGAFLIAGTVYSGDGGDVSGYHGTLWDQEHDYWVVQLNAAGTLEWQLCLGGSSADELFTMERTSDGGCILYGWSYSSDGDVTDAHGASDGWLAKVGPTGTLQWQKTLGCSSWEWPNTILQTSDGGYLAASWVNAGDGNVSGSGFHAGSGGDMWVVKLGSDGTGVDEIAAPAFTLAPVPASDLLNVTTATPMIGTVLRITDALGREVLRRQLQGTTCTLDVSHVPPGSYFVSIGARTQHLVVE